MTIIRGDCLEAMRAMPDGSVSAVVTDPPYALEFMGKGWDKVLPGREVWAEALRVARPGSVLLAFGGTRTFHRLTCAIEDAGWEVHDCLMWLYGSGFPKAKSCLKPAWEPIILARKGVAMLNIDGCRVGENPGYKYNAARNGTTFHGEQGKRTPQTAEKRGKDTIESTGGRWPANVILDEEAGAALDAQTGTLKSGSNCTCRREGYFGAGDERHGGLGQAGDVQTTYGDSGGASRFFYCAKSSRAERGEGNGHPTVKPLALMRWLVRLVKMPQGAVVLDPFMGSGTTGVACALEGVEFVGVERESEYADVAERRIAAALEQR